MPEKITPEQLKRIEETFRSSPGVVAGARVELRVQGKILKTIKSGVH